MYVLSPALPKCAGRYRSVFITFLISLHTFLQVILEAKMSLPLVNGIYEVGETGGEKLWRVCNPVILQQFK